MPSPIHFAPLTSLSEETRIGVEAVRRGGEVLLRYWQRLLETQIREKTKGDLVTEADLEAEAVVTNFLREEMPEAAVISEEGTAFSGREIVWYVDPLDGTTNFVQRFPVFAVSAGLVQKSSDDPAKVLCGAVLNPVTGELFYAARGWGSYLGNDRLRGSEKTQVSDAVIATGFPRKYHDELTPYLEEFRALFPQCRAIRRAGAASLDLCWTAQGVFDAFWEHRLSPWDIAAGVIIVEEANGVCSDLNGTRGFLESGNILGSASTLHQQLLQIIQSAHLSGQRTSLRKPDS